jgi:hypothetical protein
MMDIEKLREIQFRMMKSMISIDQAKKEAAPFIESMNKKGMEIAKKHGKRFHHFTFAQIMR